MTAFLPPSANLDVNSQNFDNVYQSESNQLMSVVRVLTGQCAKISLPSKAFGTQTTIDLPQNMLLGHTTLNLVMNASNIPTTTALSQGWGYTTLEWMEYQFANSERLRIEGVHMFIKNIADVESGEKKNSVISLGGEIYNGGSAAEIAGKKVEAYVSLYLPFSNMSSARVLPFDSQIISRPVQLTLQFRQAREIFTANSAELGVPGGIQYPSQFDDAYVMCKTMVMIDGRSDSIAAQVSMGGGNKYTYGYIYPLAFTNSSDFLGVAPSENKGKISVKMERFLNGSLQSIDVFVERLSFDSTPTSRYNGFSAYNRLAKMAQISNAQLIFSGQCIWRSDNNSDKLMNLSEYPTTTDYEINDWSVNRTYSPTAGYLTQTKNCGWTHIQLSQLNERVFTNLTETGVVLVSNQVLLEFNTPELYQLSEDFESDGVVAPDSQPLYRLHAVYNYTGGVRVADGSCNLVFQPPQQALPSIAGAMGVL